MCGIVGHWAAHHPDRSLSEEALRAMRDRLAHRGPDDAGLWRDTTTGISLAQRRLSIIDLSAAGHQPMRSEAGRYQLVYNGEIYNHLELRTRFWPERVWRGHSDTETLLAVIEALGFVGALRELVGMFAIACWDRQEEQLWLARDRLGEKPIYWAELPSGYAFASELGGIRALSDAPTAVDPHALALLLRHGCVPAPRTILKGVHKLQPAHWLCLRRNQAPQGAPYWNLANIAAAGQSAASTFDEEQALLDFDHHFETSIRGQLLSDVPIGAFLSGGVDSSAVVAMMQRVSPGRVRSFCLGFESSELDETEHARAIARHLGTEHTELMVTERDALDLVPGLGRMFSEPFADSSQIPTHLVSRLARAHVTVALSGDAGDELFAGYNRHRFAARRWPALQAWPLPLRRTAASLLGGLAPATWDALAHPLRRFVKLPSQLGDKLHKLAGSTLEANSTAELYAMLSSLEPSPLTLINPALGAAANSPWMLDEGFAKAYGPAEAMMLADQLGYLPDDILVKVDRSAMAASLETRAPFLDHRLVEFAWSLPAAARRADGSGKWLLRQWLYREVPRELIERPKQGFAVPLATWLRGPLREWAEDLLASQVLTPYFNATAVRKLWDAHASGQANHQYRLWSILMFQAWRREQA